MGRGVPVLLEASTLLEVRYSGSFVSLSCERPTLDPQLTAQKNVSSQGRTLYGERQRLVLTYRYPEVVDILSLLRQDKANRPLWLPHLTRLAKQV